MAGMLTQTAHVSASDATCRLPSMPFSFPAGGIVTPRWPVRLAGNWFAPVAGPGPGSVFMSEPAGGGAPPDITFRRAAPADWAQLRAARLTALADAPYAFASTLQRERAFSEEKWRSRTQTSAVFAAWAGGVIIGMVSVHRAGENGGWHIVGMWVSPAVRGRGVADRLLRDACAYARAEGAPTLTLWVTEINNRARGFYRRRFAPTGGRQLVRPDEPDHWEEELALTFS